MRYALFLLSAIMVFLAFLTFGIPLTSFGFSVGAGLVALAATRQGSPTEPGKKFIEPILSELSSGPKSASELYDTLADDLKSEPLMRSCLNLLVNEGRIELVEGKFRLVGSQPTP